MGRCAAWLHITIFYFSNYLADVVILEVSYLLGGELRWNIFVCMQIFHRHGHGPSSGQELRPSVSQSAGLGGWHDRGGRPGLGARVELGDWCGSRVPDRKIRNDEARGSQTMKRVVAPIEKAFPKATVELEASLSTQAVARSRVSRAESEPR